MWSHFDDNCYLSEEYNVNYVSIDIDDCAVNVCTNGGSCIDGVAGYTCNCLDGYTGKKCETGKLYKLFGKRQ